MVFGPQVLAAMNGLAVKPEELGGAKVAAGMGACALTAATEDEALSKAKQVLALLPSSNLEDSEIIDSDDMSRLIPAIDAGDVDALVAALMDGGASIELYAAYEPAVRVFMGRMGARSVGVVAASGKLTAGALQKAARFVRFMDCFGIAMVSLHQHLRRDRGQREAPRAGCSRRRASCSSPMPRPPRPSWPW